MDPQPVLQYDVAYPEHLSRWMIFVKGIYASAHWFVLGFVDFALLVVSAVAWFAILFTGRYPRGMYNFSVGVLRWNANVNAFAYLQRDENPPISIHPGLYPVTFDIEYPERLSRWKIFLKGIFAIPHFIVLLLLGVALNFCTFIAWFAILFTGAYPRGLFDFAVGVSRWQYRVAAYVYLLTDAYPPFSMDANPGGSAPAYSGAM